MDSTAITSSSTSSAAGRVAGPGREVRHEYPDHGRPGQRTFTSTGEEPIRVEDRCFCRLHGTLTNPGTGRPVTTELACDGLACRSERTRPASGSPVGVGEHAGSLLWSRESAPRSRREDARSSPCSQDGIPVVAKADLAALLDAAGTRPGRRPASQNVLQPDRTMACTGLVDETEASPWGR